MNPSGVSSRVTRRNVSPPEGQASVSKKQKKDSSFPSVFFDPKPSNFECDVPAGISAYQGRAFRHHFMHDRESMRTEHTGRVAPYHVEYISYGPVTEAQRASIDELCLMPSGNYLPKLSRNC